MTTSVWLFADKSRSLKRRADMTSDSTEKLDSKPELKTQKLFPCPHCKPVLSALRNLQTHIRDAHNYDTTPMIRIDARNGIYVTSKYDHGPLLPIHVIKSTNPPNTD